MRLALVFAIVSLAAIASADDASERKTKAAQLVEAASAAQASADYPTAIAKLRAAYDLIPHPDLLYNLGQAYRLADQPWDAIEQYERYLAVDAKGTFAKNARKFVTALRESTKGKTRPEPTPLVTPTIVATAAPTIAVAPILPMPVTVSAPIVTEDRRPREPDAPAWRRPTSIALSVIGVGGVGLSIAYGLRARSIAAELSDHTGAWTDALLAKESTGRQAQRIALASGIAGGALLVGGVILYAYDRRDRGRPREVALVPSIDPTTVGFAVCGSL